MDKVFVVIDDARMHLTTSEKDMYLPTDQVSAIFNEFMFS